jgi:anti-sigma regulatory factor (Ser/Thr protein kinase)
MSDREEPDHVGWATHVLNDTRQLLGSLRIEAEPHRVAEARALVRMVLESARVPALIGNTQLLTSELVTNAVRYGWHRERPWALVVLCRIGPILRVEVYDNVARLPIQRAAHRDEESGRGLFIVASLADRWGTVELTIGKCVWFEVTAWPEQRNGASVAAW